jgi:hypothetical protein
MREVVGSSPTATTIFDRVKCEKGAGSVKISTSGGFLLLHANHFCAFVPRSSVPCSSIGTKKISL